MIEKNKGSTILDILNLKLTLLPYKMRVCINENRAIDMSPTTLEGSTYFWGRDYYYIFNTIMFECVYEMKSKRLARIYLNGSY